MRKIAFLMCAGVAALAFGTTPVAAQTMPGGSQPDAASAPVRTASQRTVAVTRDHVTGGYRAPTWGDNDMGVIPLDVFVRQYRAPPRSDGSEVSEPERVRMAVAAFEQLEGQNVSGCAETGEWIREEYAIVMEVHANQLRLEDHRGRIPQLVLELANLRHLQRGANIGDALGRALMAAGYCFTPGVGWALCAGVVAQTVGGLLQIGSHAETQRLDRNTRRFDLEQRDLFISQSSTQNRSMLNHSRQAIGWATRYQAYCMVVAPNETSGLGNVQFDPRLLQWTYGRQ